jgi:hypothetical protein
MSEVALIQIVEAVNAMVSNPGKITNVVPSYDDNNERAEYYFLYNGKYKWSILRDARTGHVWLHYYPGDLTLEAIASMDPERQVSEIVMVSYSTKELKAQEAIESFSALYDVVVARYADMDVVLKEIIRGY